MVIDQLPKRDLGDLGQGERGLVAARHVQALEDDLHPRTWLRKPSFFTRPWIFLIQTLPE